MKADHLRKFNSLALPKFGKFKTTNKTLLNHFPFSLELWMYHAPLTWCEQESLGHKAHFEVLPRALWFLHLFTLYVRSQRHCALVLQAGSHIQKTHNSVSLSSLSSLSNSIYRHKRIYRHKGNVLLLKNVAWYSLPVASMCNILNQTYILTASVKFLTMPTHKYKLHK
jgi:hypothetical protein